MIIPQIPFYNFKSCKYSFQPLFNTDDIQPLMAEYLKRLSAAGFEVKGGDISANSNPLATITLESDAMRVDIVPGNEKLTAMPAPKEDKVLAMGDTLKARNLDMTFSALGSADKVFSSVREISDYHHYYESRSGNPFLTVTGTLTNKGSNPADLRRIYAEIIIDDDEHYRASVTGVREGSGYFLEEIAAKDSVEFCIYSEIPKSVQDKAERVTLKLGFTDDCGVIFVKSGGLCDFEYCDEVYRVDLKSQNPPAQTAPDLTEYTDKATVKSVQAALNGAGYSCGTPDGIAGKKTLSAISQYQKDHGLTPTGTVTGELLAALGLQ